MYIWKNKFHVPNHQPDHKVPSKQKSPRDAPQNQLENCALFIFGQEFFARGACGSQAMGVDEIFMGV